MNKGIWDRETLAVYRAMRAYHKAFIRYNKAIPTPEDAKQSLDIAKEQLIQALNSPVAKSHINLVLSSRQDSHQKAKITEKERTMEINLASIFGLKIRQVKRTFHSEPLPPIETPPLKTATDLTKQLEKLHRSIAEEVEASRRIPERIPKKKRKRQIARGVTSLIFASGCAIANAFSSPAIPAMLASYSTALTAFENAIRDIVGENL